MPNRQLIENQTLVHRCRQALRKIALDMTDRELPTHQARTIADLAAAEAYACILRVIMDAEKRTR